METQKIVNLLNGSDNENSKFATKKWYIIDSESNGNYSHHNPIKCLTKSIESSLCGYSDAYILVTGNITVTRTIAAADDNPLQRKQSLATATQVAFKNCAPFKDCRMEIDGTFVGYADFINTAMPMYNLMEYCDNYSDGSGSLWGFTRDEVVNNAGVTNNDNAPSFKYKARLTTDTETNGTKNRVKIAVPLKYLSNFWRSLEMPLINCKVELSLTWNEKCILSSSGTDANFTITDSKVYVPVVTLKTEVNTKLSKLLSEGFKRPIHWNEYKVIPNKDYKANFYIRERLDASIQGANRLFVLAYIGGDGNNITAEDSHQKYFLPRLKIENYNIEIDGRNFYDQPVNDAIKQYDEIRKISTGQGDDYTTGCLLDFAYFEKKYRLIAADLSKQKVLDVDSRAI